MKLLSPISVMILATALSPATLLPPDAGVSRIEEIAKEVAPSHAMPCTPLTVDPVPQLNPHTSGHTTKCAAGQRLYVATLSRNFTITKHVADYIPKRPIPLYEVGQYGHVHRRNGGYIYLRYGRYELVLSGRNETVVSARIF